MGKMYFPDERPTYSKKKKQNWKDKNIVEWTVALCGGVAGGVLIGCYSFSFWESLLCLVLVGIMVGSLLFAWSEFRKIR